MSVEISRRQMMILGAASMGLCSLPVQGKNTKNQMPDVPEITLEKYCKKLKRLMETQVTDPESHWFGGIPDTYGIHYCTTAAELIRDGAAVYCLPASKYHQSSELLQRIEWASGFLKHVQHEDGFIDLPSTNFNSPPDTAFVIHSVASAVAIAKMYRNEHIAGFVRDFLLKAGEGLTAGGIHTPNHRWAICAALAQIYDLYPDKRYIDRIDQWLAEGIDIDAEGQYTERSTAGYNAVVNNALTVTAIKLKRTELLEPVRKNLNAMAFLIHPNGEVVTEISRRQDQNTRGTMANYWFPLRYLAVHDQNGLYTSMLAYLEPDHIELHRLMEYPETGGILPAPEPIPDDYERDYILSGITRARRGKTSITIPHGLNSRLVSFRRGEAVINAVRMASAFFGKGQFVPVQFRKQDGQYYFRQHLQGHYMQPITDPSFLPVRPEDWTRRTGRRKASQRCSLIYEARMRETPHGFEITVSAKGTDNVPLVIEINLREDGQLTGVMSAGDADICFLPENHFAEFRMGENVIRFGPGRCEHRWTALRGAEPKLSGPSVYLTGYTPFEHTITFEVA